MQLWLSPLQLVGIGIALPFQWHALALKFSFLYDRWQAVTGMG